MSAAPSLLAEVATEQQRVTAEIRELDLLVESTQVEVNRLRSREDQLKAKVEQIRANPALSDNLVAWEVVRADSDIEIYDLMAGTRRIITGPGAQTSPTASGKKVAYLDGFDIKLADDFMAAGVALPTLAERRSGDARILLDHGAATRTGLAWEHFWSGLSPERAARNSPVA